MKGLAIVSLTYGAGYIHAEYNRVTPEQMRTEMMRELIQMQSAPETGLCIARTWNANSQEAKP